jgi:hypothetical protein
MMKYSESVLEYKNSFRDMGKLVSSTDDVFKKKYFPGGKSSKKFLPSFIPGQIYSFFYPTDSKVNEKRPFINRNPIVLCTDSHTSKNDGTILKGIDLIVTPPLRRIEILSKIFDSFSDILSRNEDAHKKGYSISPILLDDKFLEKSIPSTGYRSSLFGFKSKFVRDAKIMDLEDWFKIPYLGHSIIEGLNVQGIYKQYESKLNQLKDLK